MASSQSKSGMSGFWLIVAAIVALVGVAWDILSLTAVDTSAAEEAGFVVDLVWPQIGAIVALICHAIIVLLGFLRQAAMKTIGVLAGWLAVAAILIGYIFIGGRITATDDDGAVLIEESILGSDAWVSLIIALVIAFLTTFAASRRRS
ncbi:MAG: hypothetical protein AAGG65_06985 [Pseudomonadota bacterium]